MYSTSAIVLSRKERKEADLLVTLFTQNYGLLPAIAIGVRKPAAKLKGHLENYTKTGIHFVSGRTGYRLIGALLDDPFKNIAASFERKRIAEAAARLTEAAAFGISEDRGLWEAMNDFFIALNTDAPLNAAECERTFFWFAIHLFQVSGYQVSHDGNYPEALKSIFRRYEAMPVIETRDLPLELGLHESIREGLSHACITHLGFQAPFFRPVNDIMMQEFFIEHGKA